QGRLQGKIGTETVPWMVALNATCFGPNGCTRHSVMLTQVGYVK
uniref:Uncharacterized protein n=1 Tax=Aegilops tauschii subsp. strangulata TaxID=200361 RepID=A0A453N008_AEGTS